MKNGTEYDFDAAGRLAAIRDVKGNRIAFLQETLICAAPKVISGDEYPIFVVLTGCDARRDECRVAGHANEEQRGSAPVCAAKMGYSFSEIT